MKKIVLLMVTMFTVMMLAGCTGLITGREYSKTDLTIMHKVVKNGVVIFMTEQEIKALKLDEMDVVITDAYKIMTQSEVREEIASRTVTKLVQRGIDSKEKRAIEQAMELENKAAEKAAQIPESQQTQFVETEAESLENIENYIKK